MPRPPRLVLVTAVATAAFAVPFARAAAQSAVKVSYAFTGESRARAGDADGVGRVLAVRRVGRAWQDSVDVLLDQDMETAEALGFARARAGESANYRVEVTALPILGAERQPTGVVTYALTLFEPGVMSAWKYVTTTVAYSAGAEAAAKQISEFATRAIAARGRN